MEAAFEFSFSGMNMDFAIHFTTKVCPIPGGLFTDIAAEKMFTSSALFKICCQMLDYGY